MDEKVTAVLDAYHERMREESQLPPEALTGDGWYDRLLLAIGPHTGPLLNILAKSLKAPAILELGTSYGYSTIWLAEAARAAGGRVTTIELQDYKADYARDMAAKAGLADHVDFRVGHALDLIAALPHPVDFVFVDLWGDLYEPCFQALYPRLNPGAIIVADNMIDPGGPEAERYARAVRDKPGMTSVLVPVDYGLEISRFEPETKG